MPRARRVCPAKGCPALIAGSTRYCPQHAREQDQRRGSPAERGYGGAHRTAREAWTPRVESGTVACARCGLLIAPGAEWALDHADHDRSRYLGPSHAACNRSAAGRAAHLYPRSS